MICLHGSNIFLNLKKQQFTTFSKCWLIFEFNAAEWRKCSFLIVSQFVMSFFTGGPVRTFRGRKSEVRKSEVRISRIRKEDHKRSALGRRKRLQGHQQQQQQQQGKDWLG